MAAVPGFTGAMPVAHAAQVTPLKPGTSVCQLVLSGSIEEGDADRLNAALDALGNREGRGVRLCLNSPGGNYDEGVKLIDVVLKRGDIGTVIDRGAQCFSACAFLFLAGSTPRSEDGELAADRTLDVRGTLGFHAPYLPAEPGADAAQSTDANFRRGVGAIAKLLEIDKRELFPRGLLARALQVGPDDILLVDTIEKAGVWSIDLKGYKAPAALSARMLDQACRNLDMWTNFSHTVLGRPANDEDSSHGIRQSDFPEVAGSTEPIKLVQGKHRETVNNMYGHEATKLCVADIYLDPKKRLFLSLQMVPSDQNEGAPPPPDVAPQIDASENDRQTLAVLTTPLWYVYPPETPLKSIAVPETKVVKKAPAPAVAPAGIPAPLH
jgi:hypothetical protein